MIDAVLYHPIYLIIVAVGTLVCMQKYQILSINNVKLCNDSTNSLFPLFLTLFIIIFIGLRPIHYVFVDTMNYYFFYMLNYGNHIYISSKYNNLIFDNLMFLLSSLKIDISIFFLIISCIYFGGIFVTLKKIFPHDVTYALFVYLGAFSTFSYATNGIKSGAAASIFLLAFAFYDKKIISLILCMIAMGFHHSMFFPVAAYWIVRYIRNPRYYFLIWVLCFLMAAAHITYFQFLFAGVTEKAGSYLSTTDLSDSGMKTGFRIDFILYGLIPIALGYWVIFKKKITDKLYLQLLNTYLLTNGIWMLCMYAPFNNRIAYMSWCLLPIVTVYPFFKFQIQQNQYKILNFIIFVHQCLLKNVKIDFYHLIMRFLSLKYHVALLK